MDNIDNIFRDSPHARFVLVVDHYTVQMEEYLVTVSPTGWREGSNHFHFEEEDDCAAFLATFEERVFLIAHRSGERIHTATAAMKELAR